MVLPLVILIVAERIVFHGGLHRSSNSLEDYQPRTVTAPDDWFIFWQYVIAPCYKCY